ncbi:MAG TPA: metal ABC transporter ATP-binding protein [Nocardioidaceae bacterium]|nr:metal ABC transporter ATP-binding protein [Nocardioidaceae bacterium]
MTTPVVAVDDVSVVLSGRPVVRRVGLRVLSGEFVTLLGANGSGKSTLIRTMVGLLPAASGSIELFGTPQQQFRDWRRVGYVPQRSTAQSGVPATVSEVVTTGRLSHHRFAGWPNRSDRTAVAEALEIVRLADRGRDSVAQLSGGQQQRVMIARALAAHPDLLVLDEPTAGVDQASQAVLAEVFADLVDRGTTILLVAHELGPLTPLVDRSIVLRDGRIVFEGDAEQAVLDLGLGVHHHHDGPTSSRVPLTDEAAWGHDRA